MARFSEHDRKPVDAVAERWRNECLIGDGSLIFSGERIWTAEHARELVEHFNEQQLEGESTFEEKLTTQLADVSVGAKRLMAEIIAIYFLFASSVGGTRKRELVTFVLGLAGDEFPSDSDVGAAFATGLGGPGQAYNSRRPDLLSYLISFAYRFKSVGSEDERRAILADAWTFRSWLVGEDDEADGGEQMMRQILLHLLYPDELERIASGDHKYRIAAAFDGLAEKPGGDDENIDQRLLAIRRVIEELMPKGQPEIGGAIDFYWPPLRGAWDADESGGWDDEGGMSRLGALEYKHQVVLYGPPGTSKTHDAKALARGLLAHQALLRWSASGYLKNQPLVDELADHQIRRLQLHQGYSYEDFIWGMRVGEGGATVPQEGYLLKLVDEIAASQERPAPELAPLPWVLILDEVNRVDLSRLLGECFSLLEDRDATVDLSMLDEHGRRRTLRLPSDLYVIGTMNLIDQSVEQLDFALRRRFLWLECGFDADVILTVVEERWEGLPISSHHPWERLLPDIELLAARAELLNESIRDSALLGEQYELGHTYYFDVAGFIRSWSKVSPKGRRPDGYLWKRSSGEPQPPLLDLWSHSLRPLLDQYLAGIEPQAARTELARLRDVLFYGGE